MSLSQPKRRLKDRLLRVLSMGYKNRAELASSDHTLYEYMRKKSRLEEYFPVDFRGMDRFAVLKKAAEYKTIDSRSI